MMRADEMKSIPKIHAMLHSPSQGPYRVGHYLTIFIWYGFLLLRAFWVVQK